MVDHCLADEYPDIVIAGFPKAGTTALATLLCGHRQVSLMEPKEPHRFSWGLDPDIPARARANGLGAADYGAAIAAARRRGRLVKPDRLRLLRPPGRGLCPRVRRGPAGYPAGIPAL
ncbi:hypothetical protein [uncultured Thiodictyon sp.]|jgi:hypothetical protein|uniref:hypothetical protein n=1 Tax=uncultured Thiodictyon sp. TaxID=1846217 RepID=UPI0025F0037C|nr:hypothetical protein [uncultured Thiodictyon sp.]